MSEFSKDPVYKMGPDRTLPNVVDEHDSDLTLTVREDGSWNDPVYRSLSANRDAHLSTLSGS